MSISRMRGLLALVLVLVFTAAMPMAAFADDAVTYEPLELPKTGVLTENDDSEYGILKINAAEKLPAYIKIYKYNPETKKMKTKPTKTLFIRKNKSLTVDMPKGSYIIRYCSGETWYGEEEKFGDSGIYSQADTILKFASRGQGYELTLQVQWDGNLSSKSVDKKEF